MIPSAKQFLINLFLEPCTWAFVGERDTRLRGHSETLVSVVWTMLLEIGTHGRKQTQEFLRKEWQDLSSLGGWGWRKENSKRLPGENRLVGTAGEVKDGMEWESIIDIFTLSCVKQLVGTCDITQGAQTGALWWPRAEQYGVGMEAGEGGKGYTHTHTHTHI